MPAFMYCLICSLLAIFSCSVTAARRSHHGARLRRGWLQLALRTFLLLSLLQPGAGLALTGDPWLGKRVGEATHPGPRQCITIATSNPSILRNKEPLVVQQLADVFCLSETQLSAAMQPNAKASLRKLGRQVGVDLRVNFGAAAPLRSNSTWAGAWTGVASVSLWPSRPITLSLPSGLFETGRIQVTQHVVHETALLVANVYKYSPRPTHPDARDKTDCLLQPLTEEVVLGRGGPRLIAGDFNHSHHALTQTQIWMRHGWIELQDLARSRWGVEPRPTCKGSTVRDLIFLSPEAAALCTEAQVVDRFAEHSTVIATLELGLGASLSYVWPLPSELPWQHVQSSWDLPAPACLEPAADSTKWFQHFAKQYERSLEGHVDSASGSPPSACFGRSQRLKPVGKTQPFISHRPSRPGEVACCHDFVSAEVLRWFKQLRRLQNLLHAVRSGSDSIGACEYRWQLWQAICRGTGFRLGFVAWWPQRRTQLQGSPWCLTTRVPSLLVLQALFLDFKANFQALENWHVRRRREVLRAKHDCSLKQLFLELREPRPDQVDTLVCRREYTILESEVSTKLVHIDGPLDVRGISAWKLDGVSVQVDSAEAHLCRIPDALSLESGLELEQEQFLTLPEDVLAEFVSL